jgi:VWFA-related protein
MWGRSQRRHLEGGLLVGLLLLVAAAGAQAPLAELFGEQLDVHVVNVDVVVTDRQGNLLTDLTRDDFELFEDGRRVEIAYFSRFAEAPPPAATPAEVAEADHDDDAGARAPTIGRAPLTWAILLDHANLRPGPRNEALRHLDELLEGAMKEGDRGIVATFDGQTFRVRGQHGGDRPQLRREVEALRRERWTPGSTVMQEMAIRSQIQTVVVDALVEGPMIGLEIGALIEAEAMRTRAAIAAVGSLLDVLAGVEGRLVIVYVGAGFQLLPAISITQYWRQRFPGLANGTEAPRPEDHQPRLHVDLARLYARISASRATFYTVDAGEGAMSMLGAEDPGFLETDIATISGTERMEEIGTVRELAERTGGLYFRGNPSLPQQLAAVRGDLENYYSLGYVPADPAPGRERRIRVEVKLPGARARYREGFRARSSEEQAQDVVVTALFADRTDNPLGIAIEVGQPRRQGRARGQLLPIEVHIPVDSLAFLAEDGVNRAALDLHFAVATPDGTIWRLDSRELPLVIPAEELAAALRQRVRYSVELPYPHRGMRVAVSVHDRISDVRSVATAP